METFSTLTPVEDDEGDSEPEGDLRDVKRKAAEAAAAAKADDAEDELTDLPGAADEGAAAEGGGAGADAKADGGSSPRKKLSGTKGLKGTASRAAMGFGRGGSKRGSTAAKQKAAAAASPAAGGGAEGEEAGGAGAGEGAEGRDSDNWEVGELEGSPKAPGKKINKIGSWIKSSRKNMFKGGVGSGHARNASQFGESAQCLDSGDSFGGTGALNADFGEYGHQRSNTVSGDHRNLDVLIERSLDAKDGEITKRGTLVKRGHRVKNWKERYFVLEDGALQYWTAPPGHTGAVLKGELYLIGVPLILEERPDKDEVGKASGRV
jgi:hypothetical protein